MPHHTYNRKEILENITPIIENTAMRCGVIPIEIDLVKESSHWFLRIYLYSNDHDISIDDCEKVSRGLDNLLDDLIPFKYYLEVSSPGVEKKLKSEKEYIIFKGKSINLKLKKPMFENEDKTFVCKIVDYNCQDGVTIFRFMDKKEYTIKLEDIASANLYDDKIENK